MPRRKHLTPSNPHPVKSTRKKQEGRSLMKISTRRKKIKFSKEHTPIINDDTDKEPSPPELVFLFFMKVYKEFDDHSEIDTDRYPSDDEVDTDPDEEGNKINSSYQKRNTETLQ